MRRTKTAALTIIACLLGMAAGSAPDTLWIKRLNMGADESGYGIALRGEAMTVVGSAWTGSSNDILVVRTDLAGDTIWTRTCDGGSDDAAMSVCLDAQSNAFLAGYSLIFKGASANVPRHPNAFNRFRDALAEDLQEVAFVAKYDSLGERKWLRIDTGYMAAGTATDSAGNLYVSGTVNNGAGYDLWFAKLDSAGDTIWTRTYDLAPLEMGYRLAVDHAGNIAACVYLGNYDDFDCLVAKLTPDGDTLWTRRFNQGPDDGCSAVTFDPHGDIIMVGRCATETASDALVLKYSSSGDLLWQRVLDFNTDDAFLGAACDSAGDIYATGYSGLDFAHDCLTVKLDARGDTMWTATYGGSSDDQAGDVVCASDGSPVIAGYVTDTLTLGYDVLLAAYSAYTGLAETPAWAPASGVAHATISAGSELVLAIPCSGRYEVKLCDAAGRTRQTVFNGHLGEGAHRFSIARLPAGHYFARVAAASGEISCQRLVLVK